MAQRGGSFSAKESHQFLLVGHFFLENRFVKLCKIEKFNCSTPVFYHFLPLKIASERIENFNPFGVPVFFISFFRGRFGEKYGFGLRSFFFLLRRMHIGCPLVILWVGFGWSPRILSK